MQYCHEKSVIHRDLKTENILLAEEGNINSLKVIDFGIAGMHQKLGQESTAGSLPYMAPEVLSGEYTGAAPPIDMWSLGVILYEVLTNRLPFHGETPVELKDAILNGTVVFPK